MQSLSLSPPFPVWSLTVLSERRKTVPLNKYYITVSTVLIEMPLEQHTNLLNSFWTWHLNPLPSCFLLQCEQHVLFFQQNIPEIQWKCYKELTFVCPMIRTRVISRVYQSLCRSSLFFVLSCLAVQGAPIKRKCHQACLAHLYLQWITPT